MPNNPRHSAAHHRLLTLVTILSIVLSACAEMTPQQAKQFSAFAGTILGLAATTYTGPEQQLVQGLVTAFNGSPVTEEQAEYDPNDPYGVYADQSYDETYDETYAETYDEYEDPGYDASADQQMAGYYPAGAPSIDAALIGLTPHGSLTFLENGATLRGPRKGFPGDRVGVAFAPANDSYIYVLAFDATGWAQALFPDPVMGHRNPVPADTEVLLPGESLYGLDNATGVETIYILASNNPRPDIQAQLEPFFGKERPQSADMTYRSVERPIIISRGLTGLRPAGAKAEAAAQATADSNAQPLALNSFLAAEGTEEVVVTLWFNHE